MKIGIDLGGSHIGMGIVDNDGKIVEKTEIDLSIENSEKLEQFIKKYILDNIKKFSKIYNIEKIGIASPGTLQNGKITTLVNLGIQEFDLTNLINDIYKIPVIIQNDAKCAAIAEKKYGSLKNYDDAVFICLGTGIGGATFVNGKLLTPKRNPGFELGHMIIEKSGNLCNCGKKGCFETYCSIKRFKNKIIEILKLDKDICAKELLYILKQNNEQKVKKIVDTYIEDLLVGISNIIDIFEPEAICLGGSFVYFEEVLYEKLVEKYYAKRYVFNKKDLPDLKLAKLGNDAGIIGATE